MQRSHAKGNTRNLARIQRLCCLGVGGEMLMPDLMQDVAALTRSRHEAFHWAGPHAEIANAYSSFPAPLVELYLRDYCETRQERELRSPFSEIRNWPTAKPVLQGNETLRVDLSTFLRSEYYNALWRPADIHDQLLLLIKNGAARIGVMFVYRSLDDVPFQPGDIALLESIAAFVAHGMTRAAMQECAFADSDDRTLLVVKIDGKVQHATAQAQRLLMMALMPRWSPTARWRGLREPVPEIAALCGRLAATANGKIGQPPPVLRLQTPWGNFVLRAYWLEPTDGADQTPHVAITIERLVPRVLALRRRIEDLPLTAREKQVCLLLASNPSRRDLAGAMGVAASTAITHQRSVYAKLGVRHRGGLLDALALMVSA